VINRICLPAAPQLRFPGESMQRYFNLKTAQTSRLAVAKIAKATGRQYFSGS
jgi:hypothetical protein